MSVPPTVVASTASPVTITSSSTSQLYCSGLRAICHKLSDTQTGATRESSAKPTYSACIAISSANAMVGRNASVPGVGVCVSSSAPISATCAPKA